MYILDRVSNAIEGKTAELEKSLVGFSSQIMELRGEISVKEHVSVKCEFWPAEGGIF